MVLAELGVDGIALGTGTPASLTPGELGSYRSRAREPDMQVTIVGAGLGGLAAAVAVRAAGHEVQVLERAAEIRETGAGIAVLPNGVRALDALGLGAQVRPFAVPLDDGGGLRDRRGVPLLATDQRAVQDRLSTPAIGMARRDLHRLLAAALPEGTVRTGVTVTAVAPGGVAVDGGGVERADLVVAADGASSRLRGQLFPAHPGLAGSGELAARALVAGRPVGTPLPAGELLDHRTGERFGCLPLSDGRVYWYAAWRERRTAPDTGRPRPAAELAAGPAHRLASMRAGPARPHRPGRRARRRDHAARPALPTLVSGRVALLGDAAHAMTPDLGQGGCQAFEDAVALGAALTGSLGENPSAVLRRYDAARGPRTAELQRQARRANRMLGLTGTPARLRDAVLRMVPDGLATRALARQFAFDAPPVGHG